MGRLSIDSVTSTTLHILKTIQGSSIATSGDGRRNQARDRENYTRRVHKVKIQRS